MNSVSTKDIALNAFDAYQRFHELKHYAGILLLYGESRIAFHTRSENARLEELKEFLLPWVRGEVTFPCNYLNYHCGGMASAWLLYKGVFPEAEAEVRKHAELLMNEAPRGDLGIFTHPRPPENRIFIDVAFAVTPFLLFSGKYFNREDWIEESIDQIVNMYRLLLDESNGLLNQTRNFRGPGHRSQDHWSRGNGWGIFALTELVQELPPEHPRYSEVVGIFQDLLKAIFRYQDEEGCWHQELTMPESYTETSGGGLFLYALAVGQTMGLVDVKETSPDLNRGLKGYLRYIALDGSVHNTCQGCLCPGDGTIEDYLTRVAELNDRHAFGPVSLSFGQAYMNGIVTI